MLDCSDWEDSSTGTAQQLGPVLAGGNDGSVFDVSTASRLSTTLITPLIIPIQQLKFISLSPGVKFIIFSPFFILNSFSIID